MVKKWTGILVFLFFLQLGFAQLSGTKTVGGTTPDYATISAAVSALNSSGVNGAVTFNIRPGTYNEQFSIDSVTGTSSTNTITFQKEPNTSGEVNIQFSPTSKLYICRFLKCNYIELKSLNFKVLNTIFTSVINFRDTNSNITIDSCSIINTLNTNGYCLYDNFSAGSVDDLTIKNSTIKGGDIGLYLLASGSSEAGDRLRFENNLIDSVNKTGIYLQLQDSVSIIGNTIRNFRATSDLHGLRISSCGGGIEISANKILVSAASGYGRAIAITSSTNTTGNRGKIVNNILSIIGPTTARTIETSSCSYMDIEFNTCYADGNSTCHPINMANNTNAFIRNNIFYAAGSSSLAYAFYVNNAAGLSSITLDYNCYYSNSSNLAYNGSNRATLTAWKTATSQVANGINVNPQFVDSTSNYYSTNTALIGAGLHNSNITTDVDGASRSNPPTIGANKIADSRLSGTYTIGGTTPDYISITLADAALDSHGVKGPVIFNIRSGTYNEQVEIDSIAGASATNTITFQKDPSASTAPIIAVAASSSATNYTISFNKADYINLVNLVMKNTGTSFSTVVKYTGGTDYINIDTCALEGKTGNGFNYTLIFHTSGAANEANYCSIKNSTLKNGYYTLVMGGTLGSNEKGNVLENNTITNFRLRSLDIQYQDSLQLIKNSITGTSYSSSQWGIYVKDLSGKSRIELNKVENQTTGGSYGIDLWNMTGSVSDKIIVSNNTYRNINTSSVSFIEKGLSITSSTYIDVVFNTSKVSGTSAFNANALYVSGGNNLNFKNNNLVNSGGGVAFFVNGSFVSTTSDYNNIYTSGSTLGYYNSGSRTNLAAWKTATSRDANSQSLNPNFIATDSLIPNNGNLNNKGTTISGITTDIAGVTRHASTPDIGAYEFTGVQPPMAGVYTVGGTTPDYDSVSTAVADLNSRGISDTVKFHLRQGTYNGSFKIDSITGSSPSNWIMFTSDPANSSDVILLDTATANDYAGIELTSASSVRFRNLTFTSHNPSNYTNTKTIEMLDSCSNIEFVGCKFLGLNTTMQIRITDSAKVNTLQVDSCEFFGSYYGMRIAAGKNTTVTNNRFESAIAVSLGTDSNIVANNFMKCFVGNTDAVGVSLVGNKNDIYNNNIVCQTESATYGITLGFANNANIYNNSVSLYNKGTTGTAMQGIRYFGGTGLNINHNSVWLRHDSPTERNNVGVRFQNNMTNTSFRNNIVVMDCEGYGVDLLGTIGNFKSDYNNYDIQGDTLMNNNNASYYTTLTATRAIGLDSNSLTVNPRFKNDSTLIPRVSDLESAGTPIVGITADIRDSSRSLTKPSVGAYEYTYVCDGLSGTKTIGGSSPDYATISAAVADLNNLGICDDVTFNIRQGTYNETLTLTEIYNVGDSGRVTFQADPANTDSVLLADSTASGRDGLWEISESGYITIKGISFSDFGANLTRPYIAFTGSNISNMEIDDCKFFGTNNFRYAIRKTDGNVDSLEVKKCHFDHEAVHLGGANQFQTFVSVHDCEVIAGRQPFALQAMEVQVYDNNLSRPPASNSWTGVMALTAKRAFVYNNYIDFDSQARLHAIDVLGTVGNENNHYEFYNNSIHLKAKKGSDLVGMNISSSPGGTDTVLVHHNTIYIERTTAYPSGNGTGLSVSGSGVVLSNNNIVVESMGETYAISTDATATSTYNNLYSTNDTLAQYGTTKYANLSAIQGASYESNSLSIDPYFLSDTLLKPYRASLDNKGSVVTGISKDILDSSRTPNPDIGAYQFQGIKYDVRVDSIRVDTLCAGSHTISAFVKNISDSTITDAKLSVFAKVFGGAYQDLGAVSISDTLKKDSAAWVRGGAYNFSPNVNYIIKAQIDTLNGYLDDDPSNNVTIDTVKTNPNPIAGIPSVVACDGDSLKLNAIGGKTYRWFGPNSFVDSVQNPRRAGVNSSFAGTYTVEVRDSNYCIDSASITLAIDTAPKPNLPADTSICVGQTITISAVVDPQAAYSWNIGETAPAITVDSASTYVVIMTDLKGCRGSDTIKLDVFAVPTVNFTKDPGLICTNSSSFVLDIATPKGGKYIGALVSNDTILVPGLAGSYPLSYSYVDSNGCGGVIDTVAVVKAAPTVTVSPIVDYCSNGVVDTITEHGPKGGMFFSSLGIVNDTIGTYNPQLVGTNSDTIGYQYTSLNGCSDTAYRTVTINDTLPVVLSDTSVCSNGGTFLLKQAPAVTAAGYMGSYTGSSALVGNYYNPFLATGIDTLQYSVTDTNSCVSSGSIKVTIDTIPIVALPNLSICVNADNIKLTTGTPGGGNYWFGRGVRNDSLVPSLSGVGLDTVKYSYTSPGNGCSDTVSNLTTVFDYPVVGFTLPDSVLRRCEDAVPVILSGYFPLGGVFSGPGLDSTKTEFLSDSTGFGNHVITYTYTDANGCSNFATDTITVDSLPGVTLNLPFSSICINDTALALTGGSPSGGIYTGNGVDTSGVFSPSVAGVRSSNLITYSFTSSTTGCSNKDSVSVSVDSLTPITLGLIPDYCINVGLDTLSQGSINSGSFLYRGKGVKNSNEYDPVQAGLGKDTIEYIFTNLLGCTDTLSQVIDVHDTTAVSLNIPASYQQVCKNEPAFTLGFGNPGGGTYNALPAIVSNSFNPALASIGSHSLVYTYVNSNSCTTSTSGKIQVDSVPVVSITAATYCLNDGNQTLKLGLPLGGKFTGPGMVNDSVFSPLLAGTGSSVIRYTYTVGSTGCTDYADTTFKVNPYPTVSLSSLAAVCENKSPYNLNAGATTGSISYYTGKGITDTASGTFNPMVAGVDNHTITYTGVNGFGCSNSTIQNLRVDSVPTVTLDTLADLCIDATSFKLTGGKPSILGTGVYSGKGVNGNFYYPLFKGVGVDTLIYQFTDLKGCTSSDTQTVAINQLPVITTTSWPSLCIRSDSFVLTGATPIGGKYTGAYFVDTANQKFSPDSVGVFSVRYSYTDSNQCSSYKDQSIQVRELPDVRLAFLNSICKNISPFTLVGGTPIGTTGVYGGNGVVGSNYVPDSAQGGSDSLWYAYTDKFGCSDTAYHMLRLDSATPVTGTPLPELCKGSPNLDLNTYYSPAGGSFSGINIFGSTMFVKSLSAGSYPFVYEFTDTNNCISDIRDTVQIHPNPTLVLSNDTAICDGESLSLSASGGISYSWSTGHQSSSISQSPDTTKLYAVTVTNQFNCESEGSVLVTVHENYSIFTSSTPSVCGSATGVGYISVSRGKSPFQYYWSDGERNPSNTGLVAGSYTVTVEDANSCEQYATVDVSDKNAPDVSLDSIKHNACYSSTEGYISLGISNASLMNISWSNGARQSSISNLNSGIYSVRVVDTSGCTTVKSYEITSPDEVLLSSVLNQPDCDSTDGYIIVDVKGGTPGYTYNWLGQTSTTDSLNGVGAGRYTLVVGDAKQCSDTFDFTLNNSSRPLFKLDSITNVSCGNNNGGIYISSIDSVKSYQWSSGPTSQDLTGVALGTYSVTLTDTSGCKSVDLFTIDPGVPVSAPICYVTYDSASTYNKIVWDTNGTPGVAGYSVVRESAVKGVYFNLTQVLKGAKPEFIDSSLNTSFNVGNYSIRTYDNCGVESDAAPIHKSVLLSTEKISDQIIQLNWSTYQGLSINGYYIFRYSTSEGFRLLDSTSANVRSYNDFNVLRDEHSLFYFVMVRSTGPCAPSGSVISNYSTNFGTGVYINVPEIASEVGYSVYPNPSNGEFNIRFQGHSVDPILLRVYDVRGKIVTEKTLKEASPNESYSLKLLEVSDGMYYLQVVSNGKVSTVQLLINQ